MASNGRSHPSYGSQDLSGQVVLITGAGTLLQLELYLASHLPSVVPL